MRLRDNIVTLAEGSIMPVSFRAKSTEEALRAVDLKEVCAIRITVINSEDEEITLDEALTFSYSEVGVKYPGED